jgi:F0F1-type ATP synthase assembly protein I
MIPYTRLRKELFKMRQTWKAETGRKNQQINDKITFIDGVVFGLTIAISTIDRYRKLLPLILVALLLGGCRTPNSNDVFYSTRRPTTQGELQ